METDKHYLAAGIFVVALFAAAAVFAVWLVGSAHRDDVVYRIRFAESVSGLAAGDAVTFHGVGVGSVKTIAIDSTDPRLVEVDVRLRKDTPVRTDTKAVLTLKGITGVVSVDLTGGNPALPLLLATAQEGQIAEIPSQKSATTAALEQIPKVLEKFSSLESQVKTVVTDIGATTNEIKENPSVLLWPRKSKGDKSTPDDKPAPTVKRAHP